MKKILSSVMLASLVAASVVGAVGCPKEEPKVEAPPPPPPPPPPPAAVPDYAPTGEDADLKKEGAAGVDATNALDKAKEAEATLDKAIADLEAKAAAPAK